ETNQIPRKVLTSLLGRVEQKNVEERERVVRFLMDLGWHAEAKQELDRLVADFPDAGLKERAAHARAFILQAEAADRRAAIDASRSAQQFHRMGDLLKTFKEKGVPTELQVEAREIERHLEQEHASDVALATDLRKLATKLPTVDRAFWKLPLAEVLKALAE